MNNLCLYTTKEEREELAKLSMLAFGARGRWKKLADSLGITKDGIKEQMKAIIQYRYQVVAQSGGQNDSEKV